MSKSVSALALILVAFNEPPLVAEGDNEVVSSPAVDTRAWLCMGIVVDSETVYVEVDIGFRGRVEVSGDVSGSEECRCPLTSEVLSMAQK